MPVILSSTIFLLKIYQPVFNGFSNEAFTVLSAVPTIDWKMVSP